MNLDEIQDLAQRARNRGMNPIERLNALGLILTDQRHVQLAREVAALLADRIEKESLQVLMGAHGVKSVISLADVKRGIVQYIRENFTENHVK